MLVLQHRCFPLPPALKATVALNLLEKILSANQDMLTRMVYVVRAKDELLSAFKGILDAEGMRILSRPYVVMTQELPFEQYFESWSRAIIKACKEQYLHEQLEYGELSDPACRTVIDLDVNNLQSSFDRWWHIEPAEGYVEIEPIWLEPNKGQHGR